MRILMCPPTFFGIEYEINPWMHIDTAVNESLASRQWQAVKNAYEATGHEIILQEPVKGLPDMVFTANAAVIHDGAAVLSRFRHKERQGEEPFFRERLSALGLRVLEISEGTAFEGAGDALFVGETLFAGFGFRTELRSHEEVAFLLGVKVVSLQLHDSRFYHLDTCFSPLNENTVMIVKEAFTKDALNTIYTEIEHVIEMPLGAATGFACNAVCLQNTIFASAAITSLAPVMQEKGFEVVPLAMDEFMKSGGGVRCLSLVLSS